jgi:hypothetical protein
MFPYRSFKPAASLIYGRNAKLKSSLAVGSDILPGSTFLISAANSNARQTLQAPFDRYLGLEFSSSNPLGSMTWTGFERQVNGRFC